MIGTFSHKCLITTAIIICLVAGNGLAQQFYRMKADFTIKEKFANNKSQLIMGTVYYDKTAKKIVYSIRFPEKETWVVSDTVIHKVINGKLAHTQKLPFATEFSIFHICLNGNMANYGLDHKDSYYSIETVEKEEGMVITTWVPHPKLRGAMGKVIMSNKDKNLYGIVFFNYKDKIVSKQFFKNYTNQHGFRFPAEITEIGYTDQGKNFKMTTYKNIVVDDLREDNMYNYRVPVQ